MTPTLASPPATPPFLLHPYFRVVLLSALLLAEFLIATIAFDTRDLISKGPLLSTAGNILPAAFRFLLALAAAAALLGYPLWKARAGSLLAAFQDAPPRLAVLWMHAAAVGGTAAVSASLFWGSHGPEASLVLFALASALTLAAVGTAVYALLPLPALAEAARSLGPGWILAALAASAASAGGVLAQSLWRPSAALTFHIVRRLLQPFVHHITVDPTIFRIGTDRFHVNIAPGCSGYEGAGLAIAFASAWLWYFRKEYRFPASLLLVPTAALVSWLLNSVRIALLILIGHFGAEQVALGGFHSQAGWAAFLAVAIGFCVLSRKAAAFAVAPALEVRSAPRSGDETPAYLMPFMAILAATMVSKMFSGGFEWLYPLRPAAALAAIWIFRHHYKRVQWTPGPFALILGAAVFVIWLGFDRSPQAGMSPELAAMPAWLRAVWIGIRIAGAVVAVPLAEELAFRGFLLRRLAASDFSSVSFRGFSLLPAVLSSLAFGAMHNARWIEGTIAGLLYAWALSRRGSMGDAVLAHAFTNALLAAWVLATGQWQYW